MLISKKHNPFQIIFRMMGFLKESVEITILLTNQLFLMMISTPSIRILLKTYRRKSDENGKISKKMKKTNNRERTKETNKRWR